MTAAELDIEEANARAFAARMLHAMRAQGYRGTESLRMARTATAKILADRTLDQWATGGHPRVAARAHQLLDERILRVAGYTLDRIVGALHHLGVTS